MPRDTLPMIASWSPTLEQDYCVLLTRGHSLSTEPPAASETGVLQPRPQECGTVCRKTYEKPTCHTFVQAVAEDIFYLDGTTTAHCELL